MTEAETVRDLFDQLVLRAVPGGAREYEIVDPEGCPLYVGRSVRNKRGIFVRWRRHNSGRSDFMHTPYN